MANSVQIPSLSLTTAACRGGRLSAAAVTNRRHGRIPERYFSVTLHGMPFRLACVGAAGKPLLTKPKSGSAP